MTVVADPPLAAPWTCPFCLLLCDGATVRAHAATGALSVEGACDAARRGLAAFRATPSPATPEIDGRPATLDEAVAAAAALLRASRQPLFGGLGTDVAGARALYRLAAATGAICDAAGGEALGQSLRTLQDRGQFTTTLAEIHTRADLIVCLPGLPLMQAPDFFERAGVGDGAQLLAPQRHLVMLGGDADERVALAALASLGERPGVTVEALPLGDPFETVALLSALVAGRAVEGDPALQALAQRLRQARYAVIVGELARLGPQGALLIEGVNRIVGELNRSTRAAALWLGGGNGASTVNQVFTWLSGLPLRSRAGPLGLEHEPLCHGTARLLADGAVDSLLWVSCFTPESAPPATDLPLVVLGHPDLPVRGQVFIPVSTPGIGSRGHLFRADGVVLLPLFPIYADTLPTLADVLGRIGEAIEP